MNAKTIEKLASKTNREVSSIVQELENALQQVKYHQKRLQQAATLDGKADCLAAINRTIRMMKSHVNETAIVYIPGDFDAEAED